MNAPQFGFLAACAIAIIVLGGRAIAYSWNGEPAKAKQMVGYLAATLCIAVGASLLYTHFHAA